MKDLIDINAVYNMAQSFLGGEPFTDELLFKMSANAAIKLKSRIKPNVDVNCEEIIYIAAAYALFRYAAITSFTQEEYSSIRTGDIDYKTSTPELYERARRLLVDAVSSNSDIITSSSFVFSCI